MKLSEFAIRKAKPRPKACRLADGAGLHLLIQPSGSRFRHLRCMHLGKVNVLSCGPYPFVTLKEARDKQDTAGRNFKMALRKPEQIEAKSAPGQTSRSQPFAPKPIQPTPSSGAPATRCDRSGSHI